MAHRRGVPERAAPRLRLYPYGWARAERLGQVAPGHAWQLRSAKALVTLLATAPRRRRCQYVLDLLWPGAYTEPELPPRRVLARLETPDEMLAVTAEQV